MEEQIYLVCSLAKSELQGTMPTETWFSCSESRNVDRNNFNHTFIFTRESRMSRSCCIASVRLVS